MTPHRGSVSLWIMSLAMTPAEREAFLASAATPDFAEGIAAFQGKRAPRFTGGR